MTPQARVLITIPTKDGWIHSSVTARTVAMLQDRRYQSKLITPTNCPYENNLAHVAVDFVAEGWDYLLILDDDTVPMKNPLDLVALDKDVIGCPTPIWKNIPGTSTPVCWNGMKRQGDGWTEWPIKQGLQEVDAVGTACTLIHRRVLIGMKTPFMREWDDLGRVTAGVDFAFCKRAKARGHRVWCHYDYPCEHLKEIGIIEAMTALRGR